MVYAYASLTINNPDALAAYREKAGAALAKHGGKVVTSTNKARAIDGSLAMPDATVLLSFPDEQAAVDWANDPELQDVHALRRKAGTSDIVLLG